MIFIKSNPSYCGHDVTFLWANARQFRAAAQPFRGIDAAGGTMNSIARIFRVPLFRLLAINLAIGIAAAVLMLGGLLVLNPFGLCGLILADRSGGVTIGLLLFGFIVTFGSTAMGTAIMTLGSGGGNSGGRKAARRISQKTSDMPVAVKVSAR
jgi:hypothetical protein